MVRHGDITKTGQAVILPAMEKVLISRDNTLANGVQVISGISFRPRYIEVHFSESVTPTDGGGVGIAYGSAAGDNQSIAWNNSGVSGQIQRQTNVFVIIYQTVSQFNTGVVTAINSDGIDITWTKTGSPINFSAMTMIFFQ